MKPRLLWLGVVPLLACEEIIGPAPALVVSVAPHAVLLGIGADTALLVDVRDSSGTPVAQYALHWSSGDSNIASVTSSGVVTGHVAGATSIFAATTGGRDSARVLVLGPLAALSIHPFQGWAQPGTTLQLVAELRDSGGATFQWNAVPWASEDTTIATVSLSGLVRGVSPGGTTVTATARGQIGAANIQVFPPVDSVDLVPRNLTTVPGAVITFRATALTATGVALASFPITWMSGDTDLASSTPTGVVTFHSLGNVTVTASAPPASGAAQIHLRSVRFTQVEAGDGEQMCGVSTDSLGFCWGRDNNQFGTGTPGGLGVLTTPVMVTDSVRFTELHGGEGYTCGLAVGGAAYCWGFPSNGRLGNGATGGSFPSPVSVLGGHLFTSLGVGHSIACGIEIGGAMYCWGRNTYGELGTGALPSAGPATTPVLVSGGIAWRSVSPGTLATCGIGTDSTAYCWGLNDRGQVGNGDTINQLAPIAVAGGHKFVGISTASQHTCGLTAANAAYCWGAGALGDSTTTNRAVPVAVAGGLAFTQIAAGGRHYGRDFSCGLTTTGAAYCWGDGSDGRLGNGTVTASAFPVPVAGGLTFSSVTAGFDSACGLTTAGDTYCWGLYFGTTPMRVAGQP